MNLPFLKELIEYLKDVILLMVEPLPENLKVLNKLEIKDQEKSNYVQLIFFPLVS